ncbi:MAG TPA: polysaccharide deacetylase family protein [Thermoanaerobaculia bacterium]|nr:polysaccharide deacetylase family protein [Thermoanaerobaculia bacterium]
MKRLSILIAALLVSACAAVRPVSTWSGPPREVAITFDDLPDMTDDEDPIALQEAITAKLVDSLRRNRVPAIGFVVEEKLIDDTGNPDPRRSALLQQWLHAGLDLGNHTFAHTDLEKVSLADYEADILRGEQITRALMATRGKAPQWFRHPFLNAGDTVAERQDLDTFLTAHNYRIAPVTIDGADWIFGRAYERVMAAGNTELARQIQDAYVQYLDDRFAWYEQKSRDIFGREIRQVLLIHAHRLSADSFDRLAATMRRRGYRFIPIARAVEDPAYRSPDTVVGEGGVSWLLRWGMSLGHVDGIFGGEPATPEFVTRAAGPLD